MALEDNQIKQTMPPPPNQMGQRPQIMPPPGVAPSPQFAQPGITSPAIAPNATNGAQALGGQPGASSPMPPPPSIAPQSNAPPLNSIGTEPQGRPQYSGIGGPAVNRRPSMPPPGGTARTFTRKPTATQ